MDTTTPACLQASLMAWVTGRHDLIEKLQVLTSANDLVGGLDERIVRVEWRNILKEPMAAYASKRAGSPVIWLTLVHRFPYSVKT